MGKMIVKQFDPRESKQTLNVQNQDVTIVTKTWWDTALQSSGKPTCEGCGKDLDPKTAVYLGPIGLEGTEGKLYCGYGCVKVPQEPASLRDRVRVAMDRVLDSPMPADGDIQSVRETLVEAAMEAVKPIVDLLHYAARHPGLPFGGLARAEQVLRDVGLEAAEKE